MFYLGKLIKGIEEKVKINKTDSCKIKQPRKGITQK